MGAVERLEIASCLSPVALLQLNPAWLGMLYKSCAADNNCVRIHLSRRRRNWCCLTFKKGRKLRKIFLQNDSLLLMSSKLTSLVSELLISSAQMKKADTQPATDGSYKHLNHTQRANIDSVLYKLLFLPVNLSNCFPPLTFSDLWTANMAWSSR